MDNMSWLNKLNLGDNLLTYVGDHYFKHLLLVKMMNGSGVDIDNVKSCEYNMTATELEISLKLNKKVDLEDVKETIEDNLYGFTYSMTVGSKNILITILDNSEEGESYRNGNLLTANA